VFPRSQSPCSFFSRFAPPRLPSLLIRILLAAVSIAVFGTATFANVPQTSHVAEKTHQGVSGFDATPHQAFAVSKPLNVPGLPTYDYEFRRRTRTSGQIRDVETRLDYFGARYYSPSQGRFTSPDWRAGPSPIPYADISDPQSLNLYAYGRNNPLKYADPDGHCPICVVPFVLWGIGELY
jgi:RHS repeat-associated protein